jgi:hypothetical protein
MSGRPHLCKVGPASFFLLPVNGKVTLVSSKHMCQGPFHIVVQSFRTAAGRVRWKD